MREPYTIRPPVPNVLADRLFGRDRQNAYVERLIGSIRRDCLDHLIIVDERHLRSVLRDYAAYYNWLRTHLSLNKDAPLGRPVQSHGALRQLPHFCGLHHSFVRM